MRESENEQEGTKESTATSCQLFRSVSLVLGFPYTRHWPHGIASATRRTSAGQLCLSGLIRALTVLGSFEPFGASVSLGFCELWNRLGYSSRVGLDLLVSSTRAALSFKYCLQVVLLASGRTQPKKPVTSTWTSYDREHFQWRRRVFTPRENHPVQDWRVVTSILSGMYRKYGPRVRKCFHWKQRDIEGRFILCHFSDISIAWQPSLGWVYFPLHPHRNVAKNWPYSPHENRSKFNLTWGYF